MDVKFGGSHDATEHHPQQLRRPRLPKNEGRSDRAGGRGDPMISGQNIGEWPFEMTHRMSRPVLFINPEEDLDLQGNRGLKTFWHFRAEKSCLNSIQTLQSI
jgi:hypothetical protein